MEPLARPDHSCALGKNSSESSQRVVCLHTVLAYQALRLAFSSQVSCVVSD